MADIERLATELAALSARDRELVLQRLQVIGSRARELGKRLQQGDGKFMWADLLGEYLYDTYGVAVAVVKHIHLKTLDDDAVLLDRLDQIRRGREVRTVVEILSHAITRSNT